MTTAEGIKYMPLYLLVFIAAMLYRGNVLLAPAEPAKWYRLYRPTASPRDIRMLRHIGGLDKFTKFAARNKRQNGSLDYVNQYNYAPGCVRRTCEIAGRLAFMYNYV
jgi:hypothetical protein